MYQKNNGFLVSAILTVYNEILTIDKAIKPNIRFLLVGKLEPD